MTRTGLLAGVVLAAGLLLVAFFGLLLLMGDCWSVNHTPETIRACEIEKRREVIGYLFMAPAMWLAGVILAIRKRPWAPLVGLLSGPLCFAVAGAIP